MTALDSRAETRFEGEGRVVALDAVRGTVTLDHGPIPGLTPAARTEFPVGTTALLREVQVHDVVRFSLVSTEESHGLLLLSNVRRQSATEPAGSTLSLESPRLLLWVVSGLWAVSMAALGFTAYVLSRFLNQLRREVRTGATAHEHARQNLQTIAHALRQIAATVWDGYLGSLRRRIETIEVDRRGNGRAEDAPRGRHPALLVVRRGEPNLFQTLRERFEEPGLVEVVWDRRMAEPGPVRGAAWAGTGHQDRRCPPPSTWTALGFLLVLQEAGPATPRRVTPGG